MRVRDNPSIFDSIRLRTSADIWVRMHTVISLGRSLMTSPAKTGSISSKILAANSADISLRMPTLSWLCIDFRVVTTMSADMNSKMCPETSAFMWAKHLAALVTSMSFRISAACDGSISARRSAAASSSSWASCKAQCASPMGAVKESLPGLLGVPGSATSEKASLKSVPDISWSWQALAQESDGPVNFWSPFDTMARPKRPKPASAVLCSSVCGMHLGKWDQLKTISHFYNTCTHWTCCEHV